MNLFGLENLEAIDRAELARRNLNNLLTSYADEADVFTEIVQNAVDSIIRASAEGLYEDGSIPRLAIAIGRRADRHHYLFVADNGVGMTPEVAANITVPGFSFKKQKGQTVGYKGVGASYFFAASNKAALSTVDAVGTKTEYTIHGSHTWIKNADERPPQIEEEFVVPEEIQALVPAGRGTAVFFQFHDGMKPASLSNTVVVGEGREVELRNWVSYLCAKTALGRVSAAGLEIDVQVTLDTGEEPVITQTWRFGEFSLDNRTVGYPFPHLVLRTAQSVAAIERTEDARRFIHQSSYPAIFKIWSAEEIIADTKLLDVEEQTKLREHLEAVYGYFAYSTDVVKEVNRRLGGRSQLIRHGIRIASDGVAQGRNIDLSLTSSQGLDRQTHVVMAFRRLELDTGRKISADEIIASAVAKIGRRVVDVLKEYRWAMKKKDRPDVQSDLKTWREQADLKMRRALVPLLFGREDSPLLVDPSNEQEVIALFSAMLTKKWIKGLQIEAISGYERYDCLADVLADNPTIRQPLDPLGVRAGEVTPVGEKLVLEFKHSFNELLIDFADKKKNPGEIDVAVCWSVPDLSIPRGRLQPCYGEWRDHRALHASSYVWTDDNDSSTFPVIALENVVIELLAQKELGEGIEGGQGRAELRRLQEADRDHLV